MGCIMRYFIIRHKLSISVIIFTILFYLTFLYMDLAQVMFYSCKEGNMFLGIISRIWIFIVIDMISLGITIIFLIKYLKEEISYKKWIIMPIVILFEFLYTFIVSMYGMVPGFTFYPKTFDDSILEINNMRLVEVNVGKDKYLSPYYDNGSSKVTIFFLGNGMPSSMLLNRFYESELEASERNLLVMDYPMFSLNEGKLNEKTIYKEVDQYMDFLTKEEGYNYSDIRVCGYSIGTGVACYCAEKYDISELVLFAPYHKFQAAMNEVINVFHGPLELAVRFKFNSISRASNILCPVTIIYSLADSSIPYTSTELLINEFKNKTVYKLEKENHIEVLNHSRMVLYCLH